MNYIGNKRIMRKHIVLILTLILIIVCGNACNNAAVIRPDSSFFINFLNKDYNTQVLKKMGEPTVLIHNATDFLYSSVCYSPDEVTDTTTYQFTSSAAACYNVSKAQVLYSKGIYDKIYPASTTKLLTALLAIKYGNLTDEIEIKEDNCGITIPGAKICGLLKGDIITLEELVKCLIIYSGNDAAVAIGEYISGDMTSFIALMNKEAQNLGATNTHFSNAHGLHDINHYTTAYDMYLIFNECIQNEFLFNLININKHTANYSDSIGNSKELYMESTNLFLTDIERIPEGIKVYGGKTGVTPSAGNCLIICCENNEGDIIITEIFNALTKELQYSETRELMNIANK